MLTVSSFRWFILLSFGFLILFFLSGGVFKLELFLPEEYPMAAPKVTRHR